MLVAMMCGGTAMKWNYLRTRKPPVPRTSLVPQSVDGVEVGGLPGWINSERQTNGGSGHERHHGPQRRHSRRFENRDPNQKNQHRAQHNAEQAAQGGKRSGFERELQKDVALACPNRFAHADLARALG